MVKSNSILKLRNKIKSRIINKLLRSINKEQKLSNSKPIPETKEKPIQNNSKLQIDQESIKEHFFTFQLNMDLFTLLYSTVIFKWIQTDRVKI